MKSITLKPGREKALIRRHPWIFSGAIASVRGEPGLGETVDILDSRGGFLARGAYSPHSQIQARVWGWDADEEVGATFLRARLKEALALRANEQPATGDREDTSFISRSSSAIRLVHAESDQLPGLIVDRYADTLVMQVLSAGPEYWRETLADLLLELTGTVRIYERSDVEVRKLEGLPERVGPVRGDEPPQLEIVENGLKFNVDLHSGHKTGFYLDQRANRRRVRQLAAGKEILDCFSYSGGFALNALAGGATHVTAVDTSSDALTLAEANRVLNNLPAEDITWLEGDVFHVLRKFRDQAKSFDMIVLDPPKFAPSSAQVQQAARGYKDINLLAFKLLRPGGTLVTFSCSGGISAEFFQKVVAGAALDARLHVRVLEQLHQSPDHPIALNFPEGAYLKGLICR